MGLLVTVAVDVARHTRQGLGPSHIHTTLGALLPGVSYVSPHGVGYNALMAIVCLSVCLSVPDPKSRVEGFSKLNIGKKEAHDTGDP